MFFDDNLIGGYKIRCLLSPCKSNYFGIWTNEPTCCFLLAVDNRLVEKVIEYADCQTVRNRDKKKEKEKEMLIFLGENTFVLE